MKLSDIKGERTLDVIAELITPIANIAMDEEAADMFKRKPLPEGETARNFVLKRFQKSVPVLISTHKDDVVKILSAIADVSEEEYVAGMTMVSLLKDALDLLSDEAFTNLFS